MTDDAATADLGELPAYRDGDVIVVHEPPRKRRRWIGWVIALVVLVVLGIVAWIVGDIVTRDLARDYVRDQVIQVFELEPDARVDVEIGPGSMLAQLISGSIDSVDVGVPDAEFGPVAGDVRIALTDVPLEATAPLGTMDVRLSVPEANLASLTSSLSGVELSSIELVDDRVAVATEFEVFGFPVPVAVQLDPESTNGEIGFAPSEVSVNGAKISIQALRDGPLWGIVGPLFSTQSFCVAEYLPQALTVTDVAVEGKRLIVELEGDGEALGGTAFTTLGACAG